MYQGWCNVRWQLRLWETDTVVRKEAQHNREQILLLSEVKVLSPMTFEAQISSISSYCKKHHFMVAQYFIKSLSFNVMRVNHQYLKV